MNTRRILIVRHDSPLRAIDEEEPLTAFTDDELRLPRNEFHIDTRPVEEDVEGGHWSSSDAQVRQIAADLRERIASQGGEVHYFGIAEVPHVLGIAAYLGDEVLVHAHDYDRDTGTWAWSTAEQSLDLVTSGLPRETVTQSGDVTLAIEISYNIDQHEIDAVLGAESLADIRIRPVRGPAPGIVRSSADVLAVRAAVREALAAIDQHRPSTARVHLFVAAPVSVCFAVGQELRLRNTQDVQTYRYRSSDPERQKRALLLTGRAAVGAARLLTEDERALAAELRHVFRRALEDVKMHASRIPVDERWYAALQPAEPLQAVAPFASLIPLSSVVDQDDGFSFESRDADYAFPKERPRMWEMSDALVLAFYEGAGRDPERMRQLARLFFYHEYLHDWQDLTKYTAEDVGSFANCLEAIDYMADSYALLHQLDFAIMTDEVSTEKELQQYLAEQIALAIASFWAFEAPPPSYEWQERRLRRYLNWYWRRVQMRDAPDLSIALRTLVRRPNIEIVGFKYRTGRGRHFVLLNEPRPGDIPEVGLVLEDGRFTRRGTTTDLGVEEVMRAFGDHDRDAIDRFFNSLMEHAKQSGAVFAGEP